MTTTPKRNWRDELRAFVDAHSKLPDLPTPCWGSTGIGKSGTIDWPNVGRTTPAEIEAFLDELQSIIEPKEQP